MSLKDKWIRQERIEVDFDYLFFYIILIKKIGNRNEHMPLPDNNKNTVLLPCTPDHLI